MRVVAGWALWGGLLVWIGAALWTAGFPKGLRSWLKHPRNASSALRWLTWGLAGAFAGVAWIGWFSDPTSELGGFRTEATGIALAVIVIEEISRARAYLDYKQSIIQQMASRSKAFAVDAARIASDEGWLYDGSLQGANLCRTDLQDAYLVGANLQGVNLEWASLQGADLFGSNLQGGKLYAANLQDADLQSCNLQNADLEATNLLGTKLLEANLQGANLAAYEFQYTDLSLANLQDAIMRGTQLKGVRLIGANLQGADLRRADLRSADLRRAKLQGARYSKETKWPDGFDPQEAGAILI